VSRAVVGGLAQPPLATLLEKRLGVGRPEIPGEKNDPPAQVSMLLPQDGVERWPVELGHAEIRQNDIIALRLELGEGVPAIARGLDGVAVPAQEPRRYLK
jgi:hypothetical protein